MSEYHLILGQLQDVITGQVLPETHDEQYRQEIARLLLAHKGYHRADITPREELAIETGGREARIQIDFVISLNGVVSMIIRYGPGSLVSRERPSLAASRLLTAYQIPIVVVTNGKDAEILDGPTGKVLAGGLAAIPSRAELEAIVGGSTLVPVSAKRKEMEKRILYSFEAVNTCRVG